MGGSPGTEPGSEPHTKRTTAGTQGSSRSKSSGKGSPSYVSCQVRRAMASTVGLGIGVCSPVARFVREKGASMGVEQCGDLVEARGGDVGLPALNFPVASAAHPQPIGHFLLGHPEPLATA